MRPGEPLSRVQWGHACDYVQAVMLGMQQHVESLKSIGVSDHIAETYGPRPEALKAAEMMYIMRDWMDEFGFTDTRKAFLAFAKERVHDVQYNQDADLTWMDLHQAMGVSLTEMYQTMAEAKDEDERILKTNGQSG